MSEPSDRKFSEASVLVLSIFVISTCSIFYELLISTISSYLLGSSVLHFSLTIGLFMFFMGIGSYLSRFIHQDLLDNFVRVEIIIGLVGGLSAFLLTMSYSLTEYYYLVAFVLIAIISICIGLEIPLVTRLTQERQNLKDALASVLAFDYMGALLASVLFPLVFLPYLGTMKTGFLIGILNVSVALVNTWFFQKYLRQVWLQVSFSISSLLLLLAGFGYSNSLYSFMEKFIYQDPIIYSTQTPYQHIVLTQFKDDTRLFLNGNLQFSTIDEYRYHEPLVHIPMSMAHSREQVLVLGGGDGLVLREVLKYPDVGHITLVDLDQQVVELSRTNPVLSKINQHSLDNPKVEVYYSDAYKYLENCNKFFSVIIIDLPDPDDYSLGKLYSREFYNLVKHRLASDGVLVTQSTSPYFARQAFWSINQTLEAVFEHVVPYTTYVPSFGQWGFNLATRLPAKVSELTIHIPTRFINKSIVPSFFAFDPDMEEIQADVNTLNNQILVDYYENSFAHWE